MRSTLIMARFEKSRERSGRDKPPRRFSGNRGSAFGDKRSRSGDRQGGRRDFGRKRDIEMTKVTCSSCGVDCEVPFRPNSDKPIYCNDCFSGKEKKGSNRESKGQSNRDLDIINEKLNKIMKALKIE